MNYKKIIIPIILSLCFFLLIYKNYKNKKVEYKEIYILQVGAYKSYDNVINKTKYLDNYIIYKENDLYKIFLGVSLNNNTYNKLENFYNEDSTFKKVIKISNEEYINNLKKYDTLINETNDKELLNTIIKKELRELEIILKWFWFYDTITIDRR